MPDGPHDHPALHGARLTLRPARAQDIDALARIAGEPDVLRWWGRFDEAEVRGEIPHSWAILVEETVAGWLIFTEERDPDYPSVAFDIMLSTPLHGRGYGREALRLAVRHFAARGHHRFTIDPAADNERAIRAYAAVGFRPVGVMRAYERALDGSWRDALLMDLLAGELRDDG